jgi:hypothetical protein
MMDGIREYVIHLTATALICGVVFRFTRGSGTVRGIIRLLCGVIMAYSVVQPVKQLDFGGVDDYIWEFRDEADRAVAEGKKASSAAWAESITQGTEAYILEKTKSMDAELTVEVELSDDEIPVPVAVLLEGKVAPYAKSVLSDMLEQDLNIPKERQTWISK